MLSSISPAMSRTFSEDLSLTIIHVSSEIIMFINEGIFVWAKIPFKDFALKTHCGELLFHVGSKCRLKTKDHFWHPLASRTTTTRIHVIVMFWSKWKELCIQKNDYVYLEYIYSLFVASCDFIQSVRCEGLLKTKNVGLEIICRDFRHPPTFHEV